MSYVDLKKATKSNAFVLEFNVFNFFLIQMLCFSDVNHITFFFYNLHIRFKIYECIGYVPTILIPRLTHTYLILKNALLPFVSPLP